MADQTTTTDQPKSQTFTFHLPDGRTGSVNAPAGTTNEKAWGYLVQQHPEYGQKTGGDSADSDPPDGEDTVGDIGRTLTQGVILDPLEKVGQMAEKLPVVGPYAQKAGAALPSWLQNYLAKNQAAAERHPYIRAAGNILPWLFVPGIGEGIAGDIAAGAVGSALQPLDPKDPNYGRDLAYQVGLGGVLGGSLGQLARNVAGKVAAQKGAQAVVNRQQGLRQQTQDYNAAVADLNKARTERYSSATEKTKAVNDAIKRLNEARTGRYNQTMAERADQRYQQQLAAGQAKQARAAVPPSTTQQWWQETLAPIGEQAKAPTTLGPQSSAEVRQIVGNRLNKIREQMLINPNDTGLQHDIDTIRTEVEDQLTNQGMRDRWAFQPEQRYDQAGQPMTPTKADVARQQKSVFSTYVEQPLQGAQYLSGKTLSAYVSRIGDLAEKYATQARNAPQADRPELEAISRGLRRVVDVIETRGTADPELKQQLAAAKRSYNLWSIGNGATAAERRGIMTPSGIAKEWAGRQGDAVYGAEMIPGHPRFHPENARIKSWLQSQGETHEATDSAAVPQPPVPKPGKWQTRPKPQPPGKWQTQPLPPELRPPGSPAPANPLARQAGTTLLGHGIHVATGMPRWAAHHLAHGLAAAARRAAVTSGRYPGAVGAATGNVSPDIQILSVEPGNQMGNSNASQSR